jgi:hypothetical protein
VPAAGLNADAAYSRDELLSPEEERFVEAFVEYWKRRGALVVGGER